jgi:hypothetical protein
MQLCLGEAANKILHGSHSLSLVAEAVGREFHTVR